MQNGDTNLPRIGLAGRGQRWDSSNVKILLSIHNICFG